MNKKKIICPECRTYTGYIIKKEKRKYIIRDQEYYFDITVAYCEKCGEEIEVPGLLDLQMKEVDEQYRKKENIVFINEIEKLMTLYDIGKAPLSLGLGFGEITITRYLKGQVPSKEYSDIIKNALESPKYMLNKLIENKNKIAANAFEKAEKCALNLEKMFNISSKMLSTISYIFEESLEIRHLLCKKYFILYKEFILLYMMFLYLMKIVMLGYMDRFIILFIIYLRSLSIIQLMMIVS